MRSGRIAAVVDGYCEDDDEEAPADRSGQGSTPTEDVAYTADIPEKFRAYIEASKKKKRLYANTKSFVDEEQAKTMDKFVIVREIVSRYALNWMGSSTEVLNPDTLQSFQNWVPCLLPEISARRHLRCRGVNPVLRLKTDILFLVFSY